MKKLLLAFGLIAAPVAAQQPAPAAPPPLVRLPVDYANEASWLCLPGAPGHLRPAAADHRAQPRRLWLERAGGPGRRTRRSTASTSIRPYRAIPASTATWRSGSRSSGAAAIQFARFAGICRPFAPIYRSATLGSIAAVLAGQDPAPILGPAYADVLAAWRHYLASRNNGRPFVLIGHSQGTIHLIRLLAEEIEGRPEAARMVSALLIGYNVEVPEGRVTGGTFRTTPLCTRAGQTGCVITYVSFRAEAPPPPGAMFGRAAAPGRTVGCTNPAALGSSARSPLDSYWYALSSIVIGAGHRLVVARPAADAVPEDRRSRLRGLRQ